MCFCLNFWHNSFYKGTWVSKMNWIVNFVWLWIVNCVWLWGFSLPKPLSPGSSVLQSSSYTPTAHTVALQYGLATRFTSLLISRDEEDQAGTITVPAFPFNHHQPVQCCDWRDQTNLISLLSSVPHSQVTVCLWQLGTIFKSIAVVYLCSPSTHQQFAVMSTPPSIWIYPNISTLYTTYCTFHTTHGKLHNAYFTLHPQLKLHIFQCTLHTAHYTLHTTHYTLHTTH